MAQKAVSYCLHDTALHDMNSPRNTPIQTATDLSEGLAHWEPVDEFKVIPEISFSKIAFFSSHGGSSARGVIAACGKTLHASPAVIISNNPDSAIIEFARSSAIPFEVINIAACGSDYAVQQRILKRLTESQVDLLILSGYMKKLGADVISHYKGRVFNIHPSLLPKFGGRGMYGINVHRAVIEAQEHETGITVHEVNSNYDEGRVVAQLRIPVLKGDSPEVLSERVKAQEPAFLVRTLCEMQRRRPQGGASNYPG